MTRHAQSDEKNSRQRHAETNKKADINVWQYQRLQISSTEVSFVSLFSEIINHKGILYCSFHSIVLSQTEISL